MLYNMEFVYYIFGNINVTYVCLMQSLYIRPPSRMAVSRSYPGHFFPFCEKKKKHFASYFLLLHLNLYNLTEHALAWLNLAQLSSACLSLAWLRLAWLSSAQLGSARLSAAQLGSVHYFLLFFPFWLTTTLSHLMAVYGANEIRTFYYMFDLVNFAVRPILFTQSI